MKKPGCVLVIMLSFLVNQGCHKDDIRPENTSSFDIDQLQQKWTWHSYTQKFIAFPAANMNQLYPGDAYSDYRAGMKVYNYYSPGRDTAGYNLSDSTLTFFNIHDGQVTDSSSKKILALNRQLFVLSYPLILFVQDSITGAETIYAGEAIDSLTR